MALERLYLDYNATSPLSHSVLDWLRGGEVLFANPSSQHSRGKASRKVVNEARSEIYKTFHLEDKNFKLFFHSGATEGIHSFAYSFAERARLNHQELLICFSPIDHPAVVSLSHKFWGEGVSFLELKRGENLRYLHQENFAEIEKRKKASPGLIVLYHHLWVHNETGQVSPLEELALFKNIPDLFIHVDAVQSPGKIPEWQHLAAGDIWTFSAHKFGALKGIGFSFFHSAIDFHPWMLGGAQQANLRSGTENVQGIKSIALALKDLVKVDVESNLAHRQALSSFMAQELQGLGAVIEDDRMCSNTIYFYFHHLPSDVALALFDIHGLEISAGSACSSGAARDSAVLLQKGLVQSAKNGLRLSMGFQIDEENLDNFKSRLSIVFNKLRPL